MNIKILNGEKRIVPIENYSTGKNKGLLPVGVSIFCIIIATLIFIPFFPQGSKLYSVESIGEYFLTLLAIVLAFGVSLMTIFMMNKNKEIQANLSFYATNILETSNIRLPLKARRDSEYTTTKARVISKHGMEHVIINPVDKSIYVNYEEDDFKQIYLKQVFQDLFPSLESAHFSLDKLKKITLLKSLHTSVPLALITLEDAIYSITYHRNEIFISKHKEVQEFTEKHEWTYCDMEAFKRMTLAKGS